ncbi:hypothetical protein CEXT_47741 [Caerostris extrusa]|uniref:Uncharacterized protein n=1 Tax=Caerostris extrusa TaxID=172846 RepID=A0AAV4UQ92_CAEEX|nr:hypothetical protein CEXT_47741 [Caerostris extrusa]
MYTLERTEENSGCAVTRTDDARQPTDTQGDRVHRIFGRTPFAINGRRDRNGGKREKASGNPVSFPIAGAELKSYQRTCVMYNFIDMYTLERTAESSGCAVTRTDDALQPRDTRG